MKLYKIFKSFSLLIVFLFVSNTSYGQSIDSLVSQLGAAGSSQQEEIMRMLDQNGTLEQDRLVDTPQNLTQGQLTQVLMKPEPSKEVELGIQKYGYNIFSGVSQPFSSIITVPSNYLIGIGDEIEILFLGSENKKANLTVNREGTIFVPDIGPISIAGLTFSQAKELLQTRIKNQKIGVDASITMGKLRPIQIFITGDASNPGAYLVNSLSTLTNALFVSGGIKEIGSLRKIEVKRNGIVVSRFDLYKFLMNGDNSSDIRLEPGDVIFIPPVGQRVTVKGEVVREAIYELIGGESLDTVISYAGGLLPSTDKSRVELRRFSDSNIELFNIDLLDLDQSKFKITNGDDIKFSPILEEMQNFVYLEGYVRRPGYIQWKESMTVSDVISIDKDIINQTDLRYAILVSESFPLGELSFRPFNLSNALQNKKSEEDLKLNPRDTILLFSSRLNEDDECSFLSASLNQSCIAIQETIEMELEANKEEIENEEAPDQNLEDSVGEDDSYENLLAVIMDAYDLELTDAITLDERIRENNEQEKKLEVGRMGNRNLILSPFIAIHKEQTSGFGERKILEIQGAVKFPGTYPADGSQSVKDIINAAGGFITSSFRGKAEVISKTVDVTGEVIFVQEEIDLINDLQRKIGPETELNIKQIKKNEYYVEITGEVRFPGKYAIANDETISSLIERAGGLTLEAYPDGAFFSRDKLRKLEEERLAEAQKVLEKEILVASTAELGSIENPAVLAQLSQAVSNIRATGRLVIDLEGILNESQRDISLENLDSLNIPKKSFDITVIGEVNRQTSHVFFDDKDKNEYIELSGGFTAFADERGSYVVSANGSIRKGSDNAFFRSGVNDLQPGDTIVVPANIRATNRIKTVNELTNIIYQLSVAAAAVSSFNN